MCGSVYVFAANDFAITVTLEDDDLRLRAQLPFKQTIPFTYKIRFINSLGPQNKDITEFDTSVDTDKISILISRAKLPTFLDFSVKIALISYGYEGPFTSASNRIGE